jgi:LysR family transcriptional regulator, cyn operon transcriptional activator
MELRQLRYLLAVAAENNFTRAADRLFITQSALSQQIQALENEVNVRLIDRSTRNIRLTAAGGLLSDYARRILNEADEAQVALNDLEGLKRGEVKVGVVQTVNAYLIPQVVAKFLESYPTIKLYIEELPADQIESKLLKGELQLGISFAPEHSPELQSESLYEEPLVAVAKVGHPLAQQESMPLSGMDGLPLVMLSNAFCTRRLWEKHAAEQGILSNVVVEMSTISSILATVQHTDLLSVLPAYAVRERYIDSLASIRLCNPTPMRSVCFVWLNRAYQCAASRAFMQITRQATDIAIGTQ